MATGRIVYLITTNPTRYKFFSRALASHGIKVERIEFNNPEIQADTAEEIAVAKALNATKSLNKACVCEDTEFCIEALNGFPGPYFKYVQSRVLVEGVLKILEGVSNRNATFTSVLVYAEPNGFHKAFYTKLEGTIAFEKRGTDGKGWDFIFELKRDKKTLAEHTQKERLELWSQGYRELGNWLEQKQKVNK